MSDEEKAPWVDKPLYTDYSVEDWMELETLKSWIEQAQYLDEDDLEDMGVLEVLSKASDFIKQKLKIFTTPILTQSPITDRWYISNIWTREDNTGLITSYSKREATPKEIDERLVKK